MIDKTNVVGNYYYYPPAVCTSWIMILNVTLYNEKLYRQMNALFILNHITSWETDNNNGYVWVMHATLHCKE